MAMVKYRQVILPGQSGRDVRAVKDAMRRMHVHGSGALGDTKFAGAQFVKLIKQIQRHHGLKVDGKYGRLTHRIIAPHFSARDVFWYKTARKRVIPEPPIPPGDAQQLARELLILHTQGKYRFDNPGDKIDVERMASGKAVWSPLGFWTHIDKRVFELLVWLIRDEGFHIGTFALCSDHHTIDGRRGHNGGFAVDISSINGVGISSGSTQARENTRRLVTAIHYRTPVVIRPRQLICGGYGYQHDSEIAAMTIPSPAYFGYETMREHENHVHAGY